MGCYETDFNDADYTLRPTPCTDPAETSSIQFRYRSIQNRLYHMYQLRADMMHYETIGGCFDLANVEAA